MRRKLGTFLFLLGGISLVVFISTALAEYPQSLYLLFGLASLSVGLLWMITGRKDVPAAPSGRFGIVERAKKKKNSMPDEEKR